MADEDVDEVTPVPIEDEDVEEDEYNVEDIRSERKNPRTGVLEYLIKWENYPETQNTWEPIDNLKCPDIITKFKEREKTKRKRRSAATPKDSSQPGTSKKSRQEDEQPLVEELEIGSTTETLSSTDGSSNAPEDQAGTSAATAEIRPQPKGFDRGLPIEDIIASCTDDNEKLYFFVKWKGIGELDMVGSEELEEHAPKELCIWYRKRLLYSMELAGEQNGSGNQTTASSNQESSRPPSSTLVGAS